MRFARFGSGLLLGVASACATGGGSTDDVTNHLNDQPDASGNDAIGTTPDDGDGGAVLPKDAASPPQDAAAPPPHSSSDAGVTPSSDAGACTSVPPSNVCGLDPQCGCGPTGTCDIRGANGETACVSPAGTIAQGSSCTQTAGCQVGLTCRYGGTCHSFCSVAGSACAAGLGQCVQVNDGDAGVPNFLVCEKTCAPEDPTSCGGTGAACLESQYNPGKTDCYQAGTYAVGAACSYIDDCVAGSGCVGVNNMGGTCRTWCRVGTTDCGGTMVCQGFNPQYMLNGTQYGVCP